MKTSQAISSPPGRGERNERSASRRLASLIGVLTGSPLKLLPHPDQAHFRRARIARPITQSLSLSDRKLSSSVKWVTR
jgi:hypothetical protein